jgi:GNAT superfamily N-acetyltransferase
MNPAGSLRARIQRRLRYVRRLPPLRLLLRLALDVVAKLGVRIEPYYLVLELVPEGLAGAAVDDDSGEYSFAFLDASEMRAIMRYPDHVITEERLSERLDRGNQCLAAKHGDTIVAFHWIDFAECRFSAHHLFALKDNEAYLFDGYTVESFRGRGIAPALRRRAYAELSRAGRTRLYSITAVLNPAAAAFKRKLDARSLELGIYLTLFSRWRSHFVLRRYATRTPL